MGQMKFDEYKSTLIKALEQILKCCPRLVKTCYWAGTSAISIEELNHRQSFDLDFHTNRALYDVRAIMAEMQSAFRNHFEITQLPDEFGSGFQGVLHLEGGETVTVEVLSNYDDCAKGDTVPSSNLQGIRRVSLEKYLADKIQCVAERMESRDLIDIASILEKHPEFEEKARKHLMNQDAIFLTEQLMAWNEESIRNDLASHPDSPPDSALQTRDLLLTWIKEGDRA